MSQYDTQSLHDFLVNTPEGGLRKMLVDRQSMTEAHFNLLMKVARATTAETFGVHFENGDLPRIRLSPTEEKIKEKFWSASKATLAERGLLVAALPKAA